MLLVGYPLLVCVAVYGSLIVPYSIQQLPPFGRSSVYDEHLRSSRPLCYVQGVSSPFLPLIGISDYPVIRRIMHVVTCE